MTKTTIPQIFLALRPEHAEEVAPHHTVEAEYGQRVVEGSVQTLAHHQKQGKYQGRHTGGPASAPCNAAGVKSAYADERIIISHFDLDTLGGILRIILPGDEMFENEEFWEKAEEVDVKGAHRVNLEDLSDFFHAFWAWSQENQLRGNYDKAIECTIFIENAASTLSKILQGDEELLNRGRAWKQEQDRRNKESIRYAEEVNGWVMAARSSDRFVNMFYNFVDPGEGEPTSADFIVGLNTQMGTITVSAAEEGPVRCDEVVQAAFPEVEVTDTYHFQGEKRSRSRTFPSKEAAQMVGVYDLIFEDPEINLSNVNKIGLTRTIRHTAGGHPGIAGGPRGMNMTMDDLNHTMSVLCKFLIDTPKAKLDINQ